MSNLVIKPTNKNLMEILGEVSKNITHFNLVFYDTKLNFYDTSNSLGTDIIPYPKLKDFLENQKKGNKAIALSSLVRLKNGYFAHLKQLDMDWKEYGLRELIEKIEKIDLPGGNLLDSGKGYHFYGKELMTQKEWENWIMNAENSGEVDEKWIDLCRERNYSCLRISSTKEKPFIPLPFCEIRKN